MHYAYLWMFFLVVLAVVLLPGLDMAFVLGSALVGGRRQGLVAVAGIVAGGFCHVAAAALGVGALLRVMPSAFNAVLLAGALYMAWIGWSLLRSRPGTSTSAALAPVAAWTTFRRAALTNLLNPKAYLFMLAIFPQFINGERGPVWLQAVVLGLIIAITQLGVYGGLASLAGGGGWLARRPRAALWLHRGVGLVLVLAAVWTSATGLARASS
ncbi:MAG: LysE family translocator [Tahibacter sp.]